MTPSPAAPDRPVARACLAAAEVWLLTVVAHALAGGGLPGVPWLVAVGGLVAVGTGLVLRRRVPVWVAAAGLALAQLGLHAALTALASPASPAGPAGASGLSGLAGHAHHHHAMPPAADPSLLDGLTTQMVLAHVLSALVAGFVWWLRRRAVTVVLCLAERVVAVVPGPAAGVVDDAPTRPAPRPWLLGDPGRAPPLRLVAA